MIGMRIALGEFRIEVALASERTGTVGLKEFYGVLFVTWCRRFS